MLHAVDALFLIGVLSNAVKLGDLLLLDSQRKWLQDKFEHWTIVLDDIRPWHWIRKATADSIVRMGSIVGSVATMGACAYNKYPFDYTSNPLTRLSYETSWGHALGTTVHIVLALFVVAFILGTIRTQARWGIEDLFRVKDSSEFWNGTSNFVLRYLIIFALYHAADWVITKSIFIFSRAVVGFLHAIFDILTFPIYVLLTPTFVVATLIGFVALILTTLTMTLFVLRAIAWRLATYAKGVFAALLVVLTVGLGIAEIALRVGG